MRTSHRTDIEYLLKRLLIKNVMLQAVLPDGLSTLVGVVRDLRSLVVADDRHKGCTEHEALFDHGCDLLAVSLETGDAVVGKGVARVCDQADAFEQPLGHAGHRHIEFHQGADAAHGAHADGDIVALDLCADLHDGLDEDGVDLSGHDRGTRLQFREDEFSPTAAGTRTHQTDVAGDLREADRDRAEQPVGLDHAVTRGLRLEMVGRLLEADTCFLRQT